MQQRNAPPVFVFIYFATSEASGEHVLGARGS